MSIKNPLAYLRKHAPKTYEALGEFAEKESQQFSDVNPWCDAPDSMLGKVLAFSTEACLQLSLPSDIKRYLDHSAAMRLRKYGLDRALSFIESRSKAAHAALSVLPEPFYRVNTEFKCARLADELAGRAHMHFQIACDKGMTPLEAVRLINEFVGLGLWMPQMLPKEGKDDDVYFGIIGRAIDAAVWKRSITRQVTAAFENARRAAGMVSSHTSPYASYSACQWLKDRQKQQSAWLEMMMVENELGEQFSMKDVHDASVANPVNRRNELMTRMSGCQEYADEQAHVAVFVTKTAPGKYHRLKKRGNFWIENPNWNQTGAKAAHEWLSLSWERFRSAAGRRGLDYYGMRVVEPHVDGTPHWHAVFFMPLEQFATFSALLRHYQMQRDAEELYFPDGMPKTKAMKARIDIKLIDPSKGDAVAYIAKYISKNIDGFGLGDASDLDAKTVKLTEVVNNVTAWSRTFSFRQFQFQKVPSVTVWRELRRIQDEQEYGLFEKARRAADWGFFSAYFDYMGGHRVKQSQRPIKPYKELDENRYGETIEKIIGLHGAGVTVFTHEHEWRLVKANAPKALDVGSLVLDSSPALPWTCVNNCTQLEPSKPYNHLHPPKGHSSKPFIQSIRI
ncbi:replication endonuclease [Photobacterium profundum]|uniref:replication endonuclease n=1 Tax=Photobacterium profundum TaxID=74109 RepID=UPI003D0DBF28